MKRLLVIQVAALGYDFLQTHSETGTLAGLSFKAIDSITPALTCPVQATMRTATLPGQHGMVYNGHYARNLNRSMFWEQSSGLIQGPRIWDDLRARGGRVGMLFWQQSLGESVDVMLSPWPVHKHGGGLIDLTYAKPDELYEEICNRIGRKFRLRHYWGPLASLPASQWISDATCEIMHMAAAPELLFSYIPHLDYILQKHAPHRPPCLDALNDLEALLIRIMDAARNNDYDVVIYGDYAIGPVTNIQYPNRALRSAGFLTTRDAEREQHLNLHEARAFAVADHEIAHVYVRYREDIPSVADLLRREGEDFDILTAAEQHACGLGHPNSGELVLRAHPGTWFAYRWWDDPSSAPGFARHVDIHNKPGYDPCELFFGWHPFVVSTDETRVQGTHGAIGAERRCAWASTVGFPEEPSNLLDLSRQLKLQLEQIR